MAIVSVAGLVALCTGCGKSTSGLDPADAGAQPLITWVAPHCSDGPGAGDTRTYLVTELQVPSSQDPTVPGFDMDGVDDACGIPDFPGSVDNGLANLTPYIELLATAADGVGPNQAIANAIASSQMTVTITIRGYDGTGDDPCALVSLDTGTYGRDVTDAQAAVRDGEVYVDLGDFGLAMPLAAAVTADMDIHEGRAVFDVDTGEGVLGGMVNIGGDGSYTDEVGMNAPDGTVYHAVYLLLNGISGLPPGISGVIDGAMLESKDIDPYPSGTPCMGMTVGVTFSATPVP